jgi:hypothetical protein
MFLSEHAKLMATHTLDSASFDPYNTTGFYHGQRSPAVVIIFIYETEKLIA